MTKKITLVMGATDLDRKDDLVEVFIDDLCRASIRRDHRYGHDVEAVPGWVASFSARGPQLPTGRCEIIREVDGHPTGVFLRAHTKPELDAAIEFVMTALRAAPGDAA